MRALDIPAPHFPAGPRGVETGLVREALPWLALIVPAAMLVSWAVRGTDGLISAAIGVLFGVVNLIASAVVMERAARKGGNALLVAALGSFAGRMALLVLVLWLLSKVAFIDVAVLGIVLVATHLGLLTAEALTLTAAEKTGSEDLVKIARASAIDSSEEE